MSTNFSLTIAEVRRIQQIRPNYSEIARELDPPVTPQHVRRVFLGLSTSARVMKAIESRLRASARHQQRQRKVAA